MERDFIGSLPSASGAPTLGVASKGIERGDPLAGSNRIRFVELSFGQETAAQLRNFRMTPNEVSAEVGGVGALSFDARIAELKDALFDDRRQIIRADKGAQTVEGGDRADDIRTGRGNDLGVATTGDDTVDLGKGGQDVYSFEQLAHDQAGAALVFRKTVAEILGFTQTVLGVERVVATPNDDLLVGSNRPNAFFGLDGDDEIRGNGGNDRLYGEPGEDEIRGGKGADRMWGGPDDDFIYSTRG
ncbi:MAG: calcium-binding protein, partial [Pseudomonadota bacterium]